MMNCRQATELCSQEQERALRMGERLSLGAHLMMCSGCTNFRQQMKVLRQVAKAYSEGAAAALPPADPADK